MDQFDISAPPARASSDRLTPAVRFARSEDGSILVFGLVLFILMLLIGGIAVDVMRFEYERSGTQQTLDRAVLAAASLKQVRDPDVVVSDWFAKAGMTDRLGETDWDNPTLNSKRVWSDAQVDVNTYFMNLLDVDTLSAPAAATAEEAVSNIEISMVLDISGSMRFNGMQITKLRTAAKEFFATVLAGDAKDFTSINIVPYAGHVNLGPTLYAALGGRTPLTHTNSYCLDLEASDYTTAGLPRTGLAQVPHFMNWAIDTATMGWGWCPGSTAVVQVAQNDEVALGTYIDSIRLHDGTGTQSGIKYGLLLLNPAMRSTFDAMPTIPDEFDGRPLAWPTVVDANVQKYLIVMTDGVITEQVRPVYATGTRDTDTDTRDNEYYDSGNSKPDPDTVDGTNHTLLNSKVELQNQKSAYRTTTSTDTTNITRFKTQCDLARANGVIVYTIAFNTDAAAAGPMKYCATKPSNFFEVRDQEISDAFAVIARNIQQLRLTQ